MDTNKLAKEILENVGGKNNIKDVTHCFTRLRFILKDESKAEKDIINHLEGVIQVVVSGGQFQVVLGSKVTKVYDALLPMVDLMKMQEVNQKKKEICLIVYYRSFQKCLHH